MVDKTFKRFGKREEGRMMRREILGVVLSLTALLTAAAVGAQESDGSDTDQAAPASDA